MTKQEVLEVMGIREYMVDKTRYKSSSYYQEQWNVYHSCDLFFGCGWGDRNEANAHNDLWILTFDGDILESIYY